MKVQVTLHGALSLLAQKSYSFDVASLKEIISALAQVKGFSEMLSAAHWHILLDKKKVLDVDELTFDHDFHEVDILPCCTGSGGLGKGFGSILLGAALIGSAFLTGGTSLAFLGSTLMKVGVSMAIGGVVSLISPSPKAPNYERQQVDKNSSSLFDGPRNRAGLGLMVPIVYGRVITGSLAISQQYDIEDVAIS